MSPNRHIEDIESFKEELANALGIRTFNANGKTQYIKPPYLYSKIANQLFSDTDDIVIDKKDCKKVLKMIELVQLKVYYNDKNKLLNMLQIAVDYNFYLTIYSNGDLVFGDN